MSSLIYSEIMGWVPWKNYPFSSKTPQCRKTEMGYRILAMFKYHKKGLPLNLYKLLYQDAKCHLVRGYPDVLSKFKLVVISQRKMRIEMSDNREETITVRRYTFFEKKSRKYFFHIKNSFQVNGFINKAFDGIEECPEEPEIANSKTSSHEVFLYSMLEKLYYYEKL